MISIDTDGALVGVAGDDLADLAGGLPLGVPLDVHGQDVDVPEAAREVVGNSFNYPLKNKHWCLGG